MKQAVTGLATLAPMARAEIMLDVLNIPLNRIETISAVLGAVAPAKVMMLLP